MLDRCFAWETQDDPTGKQLPRAKVSDDKTLVAITFGQQGMATRCGAY